MGRPGLSAGDPFDKPPTILPQDLADLGYDKDIANFRPGGYDRARLILPSKGKRFEPRLFESLWAQAEASLRHASELVVIGYSFPEADERARELIFQQTKKTAPITVCCRADGPRICDLFRSHGFTIVTDGESFETLLGETWTARRSLRTASPR